MPSLRNRLSVVLRKFRRASVPPANPRRDPPMPDLQTKLTHHPGAVYKKGDIIGNTYEVFGLLGVGGFSVVYLVYSRETEAVYALKTLRDEYLEDEETRAQFRKEAKVWIDLERHPYIVRANFIEELGGRLYIGMEYIPPDENGINSLEGYLTRRPPDYVQSLRWAIQFCHGMEYAHSKSIRCHRDVKPANIMISPEKTVKITDFGFAEVIDMSRSKAATDVITRRRRMSTEFSGFGTPTYMPPEQFRNAMRCDERSDVYSFGVVLYQMAAGGKLPYPAELVLKRAGNDAPKFWREMHKLHAEAPIRFLASPLFPIIQRCMQKEPSARYQSFKDLRVDLDKLLKKKSGEVVPATQTQELEAWELYNKAYSLSSLGHLEEALECYNKVLARDPENADAWNNKGGCLRKLGRFKEAIQSYEISIQKNPHNATAWSNKGNCLYSLGKFPLAIVHLNRAIELDPLNESAWLNKALVEERLGLRREAATSFRTFLMLKPVQYAAHVEYARSRLAALLKPQRPVRKR